MNKEQHKVKIKVINRTVDAYFALESKSADLAVRFMDWMDNGEFAEEKNAALFRKFEEICDREFNRPLSSCNYFYYDNKQKIGQEYEL